MRVLLLLSVLAVAGYATVPADMSQTLDKPASSIYKASAAEETLFPGDQAVIADADIQKILEYHMELPEKVHLAVLRMGQEMFYRWYRLEERPEDDIFHNFQQQMLQQARFRRVSVLPSLLTPDKRTIPYLREAAARTQADLLLVYRAGGLSYTKGFLTNDHVKAQAVVEAILIDVRTGIVPFSTVAQREFEAKKTKADYNFAETVRKAEQQAISLALSDIGGQLRHFIEQVPRKP